MNPLRSIGLSLALVVPIGLTAVNPVPAVESPHIQHAIANLDQYRLIQKNIGLQDADLSYAMRKAVVLAELLISENGELNLALCSTLKSQFVPSQPLKYEVNIGNLLDHLDASWQPFFDQIVKPADTQSLPNLVIRALLSLSPKDILTDRHAKVAVLAALFAPMNQGPVGDCFAVSDLIRDHQEFYLHAAKDHAEIIQQGYLTRTVNSVEDNFFFLPVLADTDRNNSVSIDSSGKIVGSSFHLMDAPGFAAASKLMGGDTVPTFAHDVVARLYMGSHAAQMDVSVDAFIEACADVLVLSQNNHNKETLIQLGAYGFSSLTNNPVLRAVESAFAAMAEDRPQDSTRGNINDCIMQATQPIWDSLASDKQITDFQQKFFDNFNSSYRLIYNLNIPLAQVSADGSSSDGGFQLFKRIAGKPNMIGIGIATPVEFQHLVLDTISVTASQFGHTPPAERIAQQLIDFVSNGTFLRDALWAYDSSNLQESDPVTNYLKLSRTPMQSCDGDNPYEVADIDTGHVYDGDVQIFTPQAPIDLIKWCLNLSQKVPAQLMPMNSPQHAFNFDTTNPDIVAFVKSKMSIDQWIRQMLLVPGTQVATKPIAIEVATLLAEGFYNVISSALSDGNSYQSLVEQLSKKPLTIKQYAELLLDGVLRLLGVDATAAYQVALILDSILLEVLSPNDAAMIQKTAIRFAFTNWNEGAKDIYFCAYYNPRTGQVSFGSITEDKQNLQPMDEKAWIDNQQWDVDLRPYAPAALIVGL